MGTLAGAHAVYRYFFYPVLFTPVASGLHRSTDPKAYFVQARLCSLDTAPPIEATLAEQNLPVTVGRQFGCVMNACVG